MAMKVPYPGKFHLHPVCTAAIVLVVIVGGLVTLQQLGADQKTEERWPAFTMVYQAPGSPVSVNGQTSKPRETVSLRWNGPGDWRAETTSADSYEAPIGSVSHTGSWRSFDGTTYTEYDSITGDTFTDNPRGDVMPVGLMHPAMSSVVREQFGGSAAATTVTFAAESCRGSECNGAVQAIAFDHKEGRVVFTTDGIPLETPQGFRVVSINIPQG